jgi:hypothetical protein
MRTTLLTLLLVLQILAAAAQPAPQVSVHYDRVTLRHAFNDLEQRYPVRFSYSSDHIPLNHRATVHREQASLEEVLDDLFAGTQIAYAFIGKQVVLKHDPHKPIRAPWQEKSTGMQYRVPVIEVLPLGPRPLDPVAPPSRETDIRSRSVVLGPEDQILWPQWRLTAFFDSLNVGMPANKRVAQISVFPPFGTNGWESEALTNLYSVNLLAGYSAGVEGFESSLLLNASRGKVRGLQAAGFANVSEASLYGKQLSAGVNMTKEQARGLQTTLFLNVAGEMTGNQIALGANYTGREFRGRQIAGLCNIAGGGAPGSRQIAAGFNYSGGKTGVQIGLLNIADTVSGASIGLLNIVRKGYNHLELGASESIWTYGALKLGSRRFYNVFYGGLRWEQPESQAIWGLGYGIGTNIGLARRLDLNLEALSIHLSQGKSWTRQLNLLNQLRLTFDWRLARHFGLFAGGTLNLTTSRVANSETGKIGYDIAPYTWYQTTTKNGTEIQAWAGFVAGIRF